MIEGWIKFLKGVTEDLAKSRAKICGKCQEKAKGKILLFKDNELKEVEGYYCKKCSCPLSAKIREKGQKCPLNKW